MNVLLINPPGRAHNLAVGVRLAYSLPKSLVPQNLLYVAARVAQGAYDVVGIPAYTLTLLRVKILCRKTRSDAPDVHICLASDAYRRLVVAIIVTNGDVWPCSLYPIQGVNVFELGSLRKALEELEAVKQNCVDCVNPPHIDTNAVVRLHPGTVLNYLRNVGRCR